MSTNYPNNYDSFSTKVDNTSDVRAVDINNLQDTTMAIESQLGLNVAGLNQPTGWTLADRLNVFINDNGTLKASVLTSSDIPSASISNTKIFHDDSFQFKSINVGKNLTSYGYTGSGPGTNAGTTIDQNGNIFSDGNVIILGTQTSNGTVNINNTLSINGNTNLGNSDLNNTAITGTFLPSVNGKYNLGTNTQRFQTAFINVLLGQSTGGDVLTVGTSGIFNATLIIKSATDQSYGDSISFIGVASDGDMVIQSPPGKNVEVNPYGGALETNNVVISTTSISTGGITNTLYTSGGSLYWQNSPLDIDCYNFYVKYPYVQTSIQEQLTAFNGTIVSVTTSCTSGISGTNISINNNGNQSCVIANVTAVPNKVTTLTNTLVSEGYPIQLNILSVESAAQDLRVQVKVRRN